MKRKICLWGNVVDQIKIECWDIFLSWLCWCCRFVADKWVNLILNFSEVYRVDVRTLVENMNISFRSKNVPFWDFSRQMSFSPIQIFRCHSFRQTLPQWESAVFKSETHGRSRYGLLMASRQILATEHDSFFLDRNRSRFHSCPLHPRTANWEQQVHFWSEGTSKSHSGKCRKALTGVAEMSRWTGGQQMSRLRHLITK